MAQRIVFLIFCLFLAGCAILRPDFEQPTVSVTSFRAISSGAGLPRFEIGLHVVNSNNFPLKLKGISYEVRVEGHRILVGVSNQLPEILAYGEGDILLQTTPDLLNSISLVSDLLHQSRETFHYELLAKLDLGGVLPKIRIREEGEVNLQAGPRN